ncbi:hypothetical protein BH23CHL4_BH23CHL4_20900 [soil metagenome]
MPGLCYWYLVPSAIYNASRNATDSPNVRTNDEKRGR